MDATNAPGFGRPLRPERGQMLTIVSVTIVAVIATGAFVLDVGSWFRAHRATQSVADAAALAGAQALPLNAAGATLLAQQYSDKNGGGVSQVGFESRTFPNDVIKVEAERTSPGILARVLGISSVDVKADAVARAYNLGAARYAAPFGIDKRQPELTGTGCPCFGVQATLDLGRVGPGSFKIINIDGSRGGTGPPILARWIYEGYDGSMPIGWYWGDPGAKFNSSQVQNALGARVGSDLLFPVYDATRGQGANFEYHVVGWAGFRLLGFTVRGNSGELYGYFDKVVWEGVVSESPDNYFGATVVKLIG